jgi:L-rhamnose mutarotase
MQRMGMVIGLKPEMREEYVRLHANPWPEMDAALQAAHIRNYSIFLSPKDNLLFGVWDYQGDDFAADMQRLGDLPITRQWLALTNACQTSMPGDAPGSGWRFMDLVYDL